MNTQKHIDRIARITDANKLVAYRGNATRLEAFELIPHIDARAIELALLANPSAADSGLVPEVKWLEEYERDGSYVTAHYQTYWVDARNAS